MLTLGLRDLDELLTALARRGYLLIGPTVRDKAIVLDQVSSVKDLPGGWTDRQDPGSYSLEKRQDGALFGHVVGPFSWKAYFSPPRLKLFSLRRNGKGFEKDPAPAETETKPLALIGIRSCDLRALALDDQVFIGGEFPDPHYRTVRNSVFLVAVDCAEPGGTCFCTSFPHGPKPRENYDIALTELCTADHHLFLARSGSQRGEELLAELHCSESTAEETSAAAEQEHQAVEQIMRRVDVAKVSAALPELFDNSAWDDVAKRCLACANCTMVCPTCFCSTVEETTNLTGSGAERWRRWDSCFTMDFTKVAGGNTRPSTRARFRQRVMHKFSYWLDQFGSPGCVGCGRCITWCPAGIDVTSYLETLCAGQGNGTR